MLWLAAAPSTLAMRLQPVLVAVQPPRATPHLVLPQLRPALPGPLIGSHSCSLWAVVLSVILLPAVIRSFVEFGLLNCFGA